MEITAYHEAGHVFMAIYLGARVRSVTIEPTATMVPIVLVTAQVEWDLAHFTPREVCEKSVLVALAGPVAEMIHRLRVSLAPAGSGPLSAELIDEREVPGTHVVVLPTST